MTLRGLGWALLIGGIVVPGVLFSIISLAPELTAAEIAEEAAAQKAGERQQALAAEKAKADAAREAVTEVRWRYAKQSLSSFKQSLADPYSARFRDVWAVQFGEGGVGVCGVVNAKNLLGAYVGDRPFIAVGDVFWTPEHPNFAAQFETICLGGTKIEELSA